MADRTEVSDSPYFLQLACVTGPSRIQSEPMYDDDDDDDDNNDDDCIENQK